MNEKTIREMRSQKIIQTAWLAARFLSPDKNISQDEAMKWDRFVEYVHHSVKLFNDVKPKTRTEQGYFEWITEKSDIQTQLVDWLDYCEQTNKEKRKCNDKAKQLKEQGNNFFKKKSYLESVKLFTESARYATNDEYCYSIAIANRSAAFFHMGLFKECLLDIELAIKIGYPEGTLWKLHLRAAQAHLNPLRGGGTYTSHLDLFSFFIIPAVFCNTFILVSASDILEEKCAPQRVKLQQGTLAKNSLTALKKIVECSKEITGKMRETILKQAKNLSLAAEANQKIGENMELSRTEKTRPIPEDMLEKNPMFPFASTAIRREQSPTRGRYVVAEQSIKKGDVLFAEKPFAWVPLEVDNDVSVCAHCGGLMDETVVPCRGCLDALYCNSTCWNDAWTYHQWECSGCNMGLWQQIGVSHLAFKTLLMSITTNDTARFNEVQKLSTNIDEKLGDDILGLTIASMLVTIYIEKYTNFFDTVDLKESLINKFIDDKLSFDVDVSTTEGKKDYVGSMILRHSLQMICNAYTCQKFAASTPSTDIGNEETIRAAAGAYPSASMINHSCDPSATNYFWNNYWLIVKAVKDIRKGEEIFISYGPHFKKMGKNERQKCLRETYCFDCRCSACTNPLLDHYTDRIYGLKCKVCSGSSLPSPSFDSQKCLDCSATGGITCNDALNEAEELYNKGFDLADMEKLKEAIPSFERSLKIREKHLYKHNELIVISMDTLAKCLALTGKAFKALLYRERLLAIVEERYGSDSMEVLKVLYKIIMIGVVYVKCTVNRTSKEYRDIFIKTREYLDRALLIHALNMGPWDSKYKDLNDKREELSRMLKQLRL